MVGIVAAFLVLFGAACSGSLDAGDERADEEQADGGGPDASTSTTLDPRTAAVLEGYEAYWTAFLASADPPAPESEQLLEHAAGDGLERARAAIAALQGAGDVLRGSYEHNASVTSIEDDEAVVTDCLAPRTTTLDAATGDVIVEESAARGLVTARMVLEDDVWKVALVEDGEGACPPPGVAPVGQAPAGG